MVTPTQIVISASRRTDIPAFYMEWFMRQLAAGRFEVVNPYNQKISVVPAAPEKVHTIVFWSKNFGPFLQNGYINALWGKGYHLFFNFTVNSSCRLIEPHVPTLESRLEQLTQLSRRVGPDAVHWRFDPICFFKTRNGQIHNNLEQFEKIADTVARLGIRRCITSFLDLYPKLYRRTAGVSDFEWVDPPMDQKIDILMDMATRLRKKDIQLYTCCEKEVLERLPESAVAVQGACIPNDLLMRLYGGKLSLKRDTGQRVQKGCGCSISSDIGSYRFHPCFHNCRYCYANPAASGRKPT